MFIKVTDLEGTVVHVNTHHLIFFNDVHDEKYPMARAAIVLTGNPMQQLFVRESSVEIAEMIRASRRSNLK